jgi:glycosyltransferase involved in cell wall biosynthesis
MITLKLRPSLQNYTSHDDIILIFLSIFSNYETEASMASNVVLHVVQSLNFGGVESRLKIVGLNSAVSKYDHRFCAIRNGGVIAGELIAISCPVTVLQCRSKIPSIAAILGLIRLIRAERPTIIHCHGAEANFHGLIAGRICRVPVCLAEEIGFPTHSWKARKVFSQVYKLADLVVAISQAVKLKLIDLAEINSDKCQVLLNPVQMLPQRTGPSVSDRFEIGFVGRLEEVKNPLGLVRAAAILRDRGIAIGITIVGDGSQRGQLERELDQLQLYDIVTLAGFDTNPFQKLAGVNLYVQPSISEGFGLALVEAMSVGIPVLATAVGGTTEIITDEETGWLLLGTDPQSIADSITNCIALGSVALENVGQRGRGSVVERFTPAVYLRNLDKLYDQFLARKE